MDVYKVAVLQQVNITREQKVWEIKEFRFEGFSRENAEAWIRRNITNGREYSYVVTEPIYDPPSR